MNISQFEDISLTIGIGGLVLYMFFIMYKLGVESNAGRFGKFVIFIGLGFGIIGFVSKSVIQLVLEM